MHVRRQASWSRLWQLSGLADRLYLQRGAAPVHCVPPGPTQPAMRTTCPEEPPPCWRWDRLCLVGHQTCPLGRGLILNPTPRNPTPRTGDGRSWSNLHGPRGKPVRRLMLAYLQTERSSGKLASEALPQRELASLAPPIAAWLTSQRRREIRGQLCFCLSGSLATPCPLTLLPGKTRSRCSSFRQARPPLTGSTFDLGPRLTAWHHSISVAFIPYRHSPAPHARAPAITCTSGLQAQIASLPRESYKLRPAVAFDTSSSKLIQLLP